MSDKNTAKVINRDTRLIMEFFQSYAKTFILISFL